MVGSLSRMVHHSKLVTGEAGEILRRLMGEQPAPNPLLNNAGQFVELVYCCEQVIQMCDELRALPTFQPSADPYHLHPEKTVRGTAAMEGWGDERLRKNLEMEALSSIPMRSMKRDERLRKAFYRCRHHHTNSTKPGSISQVES